MRNLSFKGIKWDKKYFIAALIVLLCSIICGIVLYITIDVHVYFINFAEDYVYYVFGFQNTSIIFSHLLSDLFYFYIFFLISYFTKFKYLTLIFIFIRGIYFAVYASILFTVISFGGITVAVLVFIPISLLSLIFSCMICDCCRSVNKKYVFLIPAALALINMLILLLLINVLFRVVIVMV